MAKNVVISQNAQRNVDDILSNIIEYTGHLSSGSKLLDEFTEKFQYISYLPKIYKLRADGTREAFCRGYRIIFRELEDEVQIITIVHSRKKYP